MELKLLSWNIWVDGRFAEIKKFIKDSAADIVCLQEVKDRDPQRDIISYLEKLGYSCAFASTLQTWDGKKYQHGPAVFSQLPIKSARTYFLSEEDVRVVVRADIAVGNRNLSVFSTHLVHTHQKPSKEQEAQARNLLEVIPAKNSVLVGDFNATPESRAIKLVKKVLADTDKKGRPTWSVYKSGCDLCRLDKVTKRLDYIFTTKDIRFNSFSVGQSRGSDHLPILVTLEV